MVSKTSTVPQYLSKFKITALLNLQLIYKHSTLILFLTPSFLIFVFQQVVRNPTYLDKIKAVCALLNYGDLDGYL